MSGEVSLDISKSFQFLLEPHRYKSAYGGRGAGRSWSFARVLATLASYQKKRILCTREYQNSIKDSVHKTLSDQIELLNLTPYFNITKTEITSNTGSEFIFKGLQHPLEIKSIEGIDIVWLEEAQSVSEESWKFLIPTIRKENSEIWLSWNTGAKTDPTYQRFVINKPDDCISKLLTFRDNPFFPNTLNKEMEHCKRVDKDAYNHIWEGLPHSISNALVFKDKFVVEDFEAPQKVRFRLGADWGFSNDATTLIRSYVVGNDLFIDHEAYGVGVELEELPQLFDSVPGSRFIKIVADNSRPETISFMRKKGFPIVGCVKVATTKAGFVRDGLEFMRKFDTIHIHKRCHHTKDEFEHYSYKIDKKSEEILPVLAEGFDHCIDAIRYSLEDLIRGTGIDWVAVVGGHY